MLDPAYLSGMVDDMLDKPVAASEADDFITPAEASRIVFLSTKQLSRYADEGRISFIRPGAHRRYRRADVLALRGTGDGHLAEDAPVDPHPE